MTDQDRKIKVAICGGGVAGLCLAIGLLKHPQFDVQIYEGAQSFREVGAGFHLSVNAQESLGMISEELRGTLARAGGLEVLSGSHIFVAKGAQTPILLREIKPDKPVVSVHRGHWLRELLKHVPDERQHTGKRLTHITSSHPVGADSSTTLSTSNDPIEELTLHFADGTTSSADLLIGSDGSYSAVRRYILGDGHPAAMPIYRGAVAHQGVVSAEEYYAQIDPAAVGNSQRFMLISGETDPRAPRTLRMVCSLHDGGENVFILLTIPSETHHYRQDLGDTAVAPDWGGLETELEGWAPIARGLFKLLRSCQPLTTWSLADHLHAPTYYRGAVCLLGDAAHAMMPSAAAGAGQAMEDAMVLEALLGRVETRERIPAALKAYDKVRRPRSQMVVEISRGRSEVTLDEMRGLGLEVEGGDGKEVMSLTGSEFIMGFNLEKHRKEAIAAMEE